MSRALTSLLTIACLLCMPVSCQAWDKVAGIGEDKYYHFGAGLAMDYVIKQDRHISWLERKGIILMIGLAKEYADQQRGGRMDPQDLGATLIGGFTLDIARW